MLSNSNKIQPLAK